MLDEITATLFSNLFDLENLFDLIHSVLDLKKKVLVPLPDMTEKLSTGT